MSNRGKFITYTIIAIASAYAGIFVYQRYQRKQSDKKVVTIDEALEILDKK